jgi:hypothetical protein
MIPPPSPFHAVKVFLPSFLARFSCKEAANGKGDVASFEVTSLEVTSLAVLASPQLPLLQIKQTTNCAANICRMRIRDISRFAPTRHDHATAETTSFHCPNCQTRYKVVKVEASKEHDRPLSCLSCGAPLINREGKFALKYFRTDGRAMPTERQRLV